ncbi:MAG: carboxymuconolactone decarboxylase family protein [Sphingobacterium sp.]
MKQRINIQELHPKAYAGMVALEQTLHNNELNQTHLDLIKIRASQINGCAFCISMHTKDALKNGETAQRIFLLDAWRETDHFSLAEQIILAITEEITHISQQGLSEETYSSAVEKFSESYIAQIIMAAVTINAWNRIAISTHKPIE